MTGKPTASPEENYVARLDAIQADLARRAAQPSISTEVMDIRIAEWRAKRDRKNRLDLA